MEEWHMLPHSPKDCASHEGCWRLARWNAMVTVAEKNYADLA